MTLAIKDVYEAITTPINTMNALSRSLKRMQMGLYRPQRHIARSRGELWQLLVAKSSVVLLYYCVNLKKAGIF